MSLQFTSPAPSLQSFARRLRLGLLTPHNPFDRGTFSGTSFFAARALASRPDIDLHILGPHRQPTPLNRLKVKLLRQPPVVPQPETFETKELDMVLGLVATPLLDQFSRHHRVPYLHVTDATPQFLHDTYKWDIPRDADALERRVSRRAFATIYSSDYMAAKARRELGLESPFCIPFGINIEKLPENCPTKSRDGVVNLLFVCSDWQRKGGDKALAAFDALEAKGVRARMTVVGHAPESCRTHPGVTTTGFLDKNRPADAAILADLYRKAHLMLLPTRADCTPMVVAEAMAYGTPVLASDVGGMATLVIDGTGRLLDPNAHAGAWADAAYGLLSNARLYRDTSEKAFSHAHSKLTWRVWAQSIRMLAETSLTSAAAA